MKKFLLVNILILSVLFAFVLQSCEKKNNIIGKWRLVSEDYYFNGEICGCRIPSFDEMICEFKANGIVDIYEYGEFTATKKYTYNKNIIVITENDDKEYSETFEVIKLTSKYMEWKFSGKESGYTTNWFFLNISLITNH